MGTVRLYRPKGSVVAVASTAPPVALSVAVTSTSGRRAGCPESVTVPEIVPVVGPERPPGTSGARGTRGSGAAEPQPQSISDTAMASTAGWMPFLPIAPSPGPIVYSIHSQSHCNQRGPARQCAPREPGASFGG